ncbi:response regulator [Paraburkholderia phymatum]|uniref:response regulator transcription factor n=1 Tax=Paraburkholderia phymatum TaxID=148447 RepID=UPI00317FE4BC
MHRPVITILLVDDDTKILQLLRIILEAEGGYHVLTAPDGEVAAAIIDDAMSRLPDLIVTDRMMPHVDGVALCRWLKADPATASIPVVMLSAALLPLPSEPLWNVFLRKPISIARLLEVVASLLDERAKLSGRFTHSMNEPPVTGAGVPQHTHPNE